MELITDRIHPFVHYVDSGSYSLINKEPQPRNLNIAGLLDTVMWRGGLLATCYNLEFYQDLALRVLRLDTIWGEEEDSRRPAITKWRWKSWQVPPSRWDVKAKMKVFLRTNTHTYAERERERKHKHGCVHSRREKKHRKYGMEGYIISYRKQNLKVLFAMLKFTAATKSKNRSTKFSFVVMDGLPWIYALQ